MDSILSCGQRLLADWYHQLESEWEESQHKLTAAEQQFGQSAADEETVVFSEDYELLAGMNRTLQ